MTEDERIAKLFKIYQDSDPYGRLKDPDAIASLMDFIAGYKSRQPDSEELKALQGVIETWSIVIIEQKKQIESLTCCGNCVNLNKCTNDSKEANYPFGKCEKWKVGNNK